MNLMNSRKILSSAFAWSIASSFWDGTHAVAVAQTLPTEIQSNLPAGYYIYLGAKPGQETPKGFTLNFSGSGQWQSVPVRVAPSSKPEPGAKVADPTSANVQWDSYNFPLIKWKAHAITTVDGGIAQLETTFDSTGSYSGVLKYKLRLFKVPTIPPRVHVQLLDNDGFKLCEFSIASNKFHPIPGTQLFEAIDQAPCSARDYSLARDYSVQ